MTREEGISKVKEYTFKEPKDLDIFLNWIGMDKNQFFEIIDEKRDRQIWAFSKKNGWYLKDNITNHINDKGSRKSDYQKKENLNILIQIKIATIRVMNIC